MSARSGPEGASRPMAVRLELVREHLIDVIHDAVVERDGRDVSPERQRLLDDVLRRVVAPTTVVASASRAAAGAARSGYEARIIECELFQAARVPSAELRDAVETQRAVGDSWADAAATVAAELARGEPSGRPDPDDAAAISWRIAGPGGHVRHYLAMRTAQEARAGSVGAAELKRCWMYGFLLRCCEEAAPAA